MHKNDLATGSAHRPRVTLAVAQPETGMAQAPAVSPTARIEVLEPLILLETAAGEAKAASPTTL
ncbi:MAG: hypothetical protein DCF24_03165 [Cyanobium sp.]|nr:MAG: hypothetical protein DCF24_03165 [Cyanobium sp.]